MKPYVFKTLLNFYPPYIGTGIRIRHLSRDYRELVVEMKLRFFNRNFVGTHFGGSLYAMIDPFYMLMLIHVLGPEFIVWDKAATIEFVKPGRGKVSARFEITDEMVAEIHACTTDGQKYLPEYAVDVLDRDGDLVARAIKTLYIRRASVEV